MFVDVLVLEVGLLAADGRDAAEGARDALLLDELREGVAPGVGLLHLQHLDLVVLQVVVEHVVQLLPEHAPAVVPLRVEPQHLVGVLEELLAHVAAGGALEGHGGVGALLRGRAVQRIEDRGRRAALPHARLRHRAVRQVLVLWNLVLELHPHPVDLEELFCESIAACQVEVAAVQRDGFGVGKLEQSDKLLAIFGFLCAVFCNAVTLHEDALRVATVRLAVLVDLNGIVNQVVEDGEFTDSEWLSQILWHLLSRERLEPQDFPVQPRESRNKFPFSRHRLRRHPRHWSGWNGGILFKRNVELDGCAAAIVEGVRFPEVRPRGIAEAVSREEGHIAFRTTTKL
mmetsp:Transcript_74665/g.112497  ORF Transcript_74665/g.112497 Transcript_74665/m.112497 type:complete len:343 (+) Transcript_74665:1105-2133(+)